MIYTFFLGLILAVFSGVAIATFYPEPDAPDYSYPETYPIDEAQQQEADKRNVQDWQVYDEKQQNYSRNVAVVTLVFSILYIVVSTSNVVKVPVLKDGLMLGGVFTLFYSMIRGIAAGDDIFRFVVITVGLVIAIWLGWNRFGEHETPKTK